MVLFSLIYLFNFIIKFSLSHQIQKKAPGRRGFRRRTVKWSEVEGNPVKSANHSSTLPEYHCTKVQLYHYTKVLLSLLQGSSMTALFQGTRRKVPLSLLCSTLPLFQGISPPLLINTRTSVTLSWSLSTSITPLQYHSLNSWYHGPTLPALQYHWFFEAALCRAFSGRPAAPGAAWQSL